MGIREIPLLPFGRRAGDEGLADQPVPFWFLWLASVYLAGTRYLLSPR
jgi:hypothetical protein